MRRAMRRAMQCVMALVVCSLVAGCFGVPVDQVAGASVPGASGAAAPFRTELRPGIYSGTSSCEVRQTGAVNSTETVEQNVSLEISENGILIVLGQEVAVGATLTEGFVVTRVVAVPGGIAIHAAGDRTTSLQGTLLAVLTNEGQGIRDTIDATLIDSSGTANLSCDTFLAPR